MSAEGTTWGDGSVKTISWQIGQIAGQEIPSRLHVCDPSGKRMTLCGARGNWVYGNFGHNDSGKCKRCVVIARARGLRVEWDDE